MFTSATRELQILPLGGQGCEARVKGAWFVSVQEGGDAGWGQAQLWEGRSAG